MSQNKNVTVNAILAAKDADGDREWVRDYILGRHGHSAEAAADNLTDAGHPISATTIKVYRRFTERQEQSVKV